MPFSQRPLSSLPIESLTIRPWNDLDLDNLDLVYDLDLRCVKPDAQVAELAFSMR